MSIDLTEEELEFLYRVVKRSIEFVKMGIKNGNLDGDFTTDKHKLQVLENKLRSGIKYDH